MVKLICKKCDADVSGPDTADVEATMARHVAKKHDRKKVLRGNRN